MDIKELEAFNSEVIEIYDSGAIRGPIHLDGGNGEQLIKAFERNFKDKDNTFIFCTWRNHWKWLLSGRNKDDLMKQILDKKSMHVADKNFFVSSIVAGISPIALGIALAYKLKGENKNVLCFLGDMGAKCGLSIECIEYAIGHDLPIVYIIEDNGLSVRAKTREVWGENTKVNQFDYFVYERQYNHAGTGLNGKKKYVMF